MQGDCTTIPIPSEGLIEGNQRSRHGRTSGPARRSTRGQWTAEEDETLKKAVQLFKGKNWKKIAECFKDRTDVQCLHRWQKVLNPELVKGPWTKEEDEMIIELVNKYGPKKWSTIARYLPGRIGKQCRERWHNHLNPAINKEAWTQEEELILIRAHQIYGNRWAELTKFLPGRTDNGIKNHWHSSVKKKLDSYVASGLLDQYQALPLVPFQKGSMPSSSVDMQRIRDENGFLGGVLENESECSQNPSMVVCLASASGLPNGVIDTGQHFHTSEIPCKNEQATMAAYHQEQYYYPMMDDITITISEASSGMEDSSKFPDQELSQDVVTSSRLDCQLSLQGLPDIASLELRDESAGLPTPCTNESNQQVMNGSVWTSNSFKSPNCISNTDGTAYNNMLISDAECCKVLFPSEENKGQCVSGNLIQEPKEVEQAESQDSLPFASSSDIQMSDSIRTPASQSCPSRSNTLTAPCKESLRPAPLIISADKHAKESKGLICHPFEAETKCISANDSFIFMDDPVSSPWNDGTGNSSQEGRTFHVNDSKKLVPVNDFASQADFKPGFPTVKGEPDVNNEQQEDAEALCHEPLRFPSLDVPFFSCDLLNSKNDFLQDYSPLGIRKLLMSTMTCMSPLRLWDSPTRDRSPVDLLKRGTKASFGATSILKKRHRDLLSPLSERRSDKKLETGMTTSLAKDFSRLDVIFDEDENSKSSMASIPRNSSHAFLDEKENQCHPLHAEHEGNEKSNELPGENSYSSNSLDKGEKECLKTNAEEKEETEPAAPNEDNHSRVLAEFNTNKPLLFSPNQSFSKADKALDLSTQNPINQLRRTLVATSSKEHSPASLCLVINSPSRTRNTESHLLDNATSTVDNENLSIFCGTPFRNLESPSSWKSPLFFNSFLSSPRFNSEITIEDMGYLFSPGDRNYDAIGFLKQLNDHAAATTVTDAMEVLSSDSPEKASKQRQTNVDKENAPVLAERRVLDFNDCESPEKPTKNIRTSIASLTNGCSSPSSSFLLKDCR